MHDCGSADTDHGSCSGELRGGGDIESVLIPASPDLFGVAFRPVHPLRVSYTQVGCAYGCKFCASGLEGLETESLPQGKSSRKPWKRNGRRKPASIISALMGMGEPLAN